MNYAPIIKEIGRGARGARDMESSQAETLFGAILDGLVPDMELGAILLSLRIKGESGDEMLAFVRAMQARTATVAVPPGPRCVLLPTFNGARKQANLTPLVALLLARQGVPVLMHGRHDFDSRVSPFELLTALGLPLSSSPEQAGQQLAERRIACLSLASLNPGMDRLMALRPRMGVRNSGHSVAKLLDCAPGRSVRVVAVTHPEYLDSMGKILPKLTEDDGRALLMRASEGEAYAHLRRADPLRGYRDGQVSDMHPPDASALDWPLSSAIEPEPNAALIQAMLDGREAIPTRIQEQVQALLELATR